MLPWKDKETVKAILRIEKARLPIARMSIVSSPSKEWFKRHRPLDCGQAGPKDAGSLRDVYPAK